MTNEQTSPTRLGGANMPADQGLTGLGLLMQLGGSLFTAFGVLFFFAALLTSLHAGGSAGVFFLVGTLTLVRSALHKRAGTQLLYGSPSGAFSGVKHYIVVALVQSLGAAYLVNSIGGSAGKTALGLFVLLAAWPIAVGAILFGSKRFRGIREEVPMAEDLGFESAAVLMTLFGLLGALTIGTTFLVLFEMDALSFSTVPSVLSLGVLAMFLYRSILETKAGLKGTSGASTEAASEAAHKYFGFGVSSSVIAAAVLLVVQFVGPGPGSGFAGLISMGLMGYVLLAWPLILRRYFVERNFAVLLDESRQVRRAADSGLTALGWFLLASATFAIGLWFFQYLSYEPVSPDLYYDLSANRSPFMTALASQVKPEIVGLAIPLVCLAAAVELVRMGRYHKQLAIAWGVVASILTVYNFWPLLVHPELFLLDGFRSVPVFVPLVMALTPPLATIALVTRHLMPEARARYRAEAS